MNLSVRSYEKELLDRDDIPFADIAQNMKELDFINTHLGGHGITIKGFQQLLLDRKKISVCEIGCGGGDNLKAIAGYCKKKGIEVALTGIDINKDCIAVAASQLKSLQPLLIHSDYSQVNFGTNKPHVIFSSLFCHHFKEPELATMLKWMKQNSTTGFFINDLHRHWLAYYSIKWLTALFSKSYLVKNDAPLSVKRGFKKKDWVQLLRNAHNNDYSLRWKWAFRWLLVSPNNSMIN